MLIYKSDESNPHPLTSKIQLTLRQIIRFLIKSEDSPTTIPKSTQPNVSACQNRLRQQPEHPLHLHKDYIEIIQAY